jgi:methylenetetrahydrofolate--tRNA-(uracil-5-)-methyltransferase
LSESLQTLIGAELLAFYDAAAPIVQADSLDTTRIFAASRYGKGGGDDYLNCALDEAEYLRFYEALIAARRVKEKDFEQRELFSACQPLEEIARRGPDALRYGALKPVGITDPRTGSQPWALVQLRAEDRRRNLYNLVGFQTNLTWDEQRRVFSLIPGLAQAKFSRFGVMHRNTFVDAPRVLNPDLSLKVAPHIRLAGQISGTEGYLEAVGSGLMCARYLADKQTEATTKENLRLLPSTTVLGALLAHSTDPTLRDYQPLHVNFGLLPPLHPAPASKRRRRRAWAQRSLADLKAFVQ